MYEIKGFIFKEVDGEVKRFPITPGLYATSYQEVHDVMKEMEITHYLFTLTEVKK